jgi:hypothetical protein
MLRPKSRFISNIHIAQDGCSEKRLLHSASTLPSEPLNQWRVTKLLLWNANLLSTRLCSLTKINIKTTPTLALSFTPTANSHLYWGHFVTMWFHWLQTRQAERVSCSKYSSIISLLITAVSIKLPTSRSPHIDLAMSISRQP